MEIEKSKVLIQFLLLFRQSGDVFFFLCARRLRGYTATMGFLRLERNDSGKYKKVENFVLSVELPG